MAVFDSYSSRSGEIFFNEIYKSSKQINSQKTSQSILFMCRAKFGTAEISEDPVYFSKIYYESHRTVESHQKFVYRPLPQTSTTAPTYMARNGGHQAVRRAGSCFLDNSVHYTDHAVVQFGKHKMAVYFY